MKTAIVIGATGLIGKQLTGLLFESPHYSQVIALVRKPLNWKHAKLKEVLFDFDAPDAAIIQGDDVFCCLGTTARAAGSEQAQYKVDYQYPLEIGKIAAQNGAKRFILVSSLGADAKSSNFYLRTKGVLEQDLAALPFEQMIAVRPSILLGSRDEFRLGEKIGIGLVTLFDSFMVGSLKKYRGINARQVARAMIALAQLPGNGYSVVESDVLHDTV
jgi:uncharacterized protein YbjT (DUF2867 family)